MKTLMGWLGIAEDTIKKLAIEAMRHEEGDIKYEKKKFITFQKKSLPKNSHKLEIWLEKYLEQDLTTVQYEKIDQLLNYLKKRGIEPDWYDFYYSPDQTADFHRRVIVPFYWHGEIIGHTGRLFDTGNKEVKYWTETQPGYVFNMDAQDWNRKFVLVMEGPFDAISLSGVAILGSDVNDVQRELIQGLNRQIIVVPDRDQAGQKLIEQAKEFGWSVAFPEWPESITDVADAVSKYGRLFTLQSILKSTESSALKIDLKKKKYGQ
jgi:DNA primase